jgi:hypothetical protein
LKHFIVHQDFGLGIIPFSFSSVAHVWVPGAKTTGQIAGKKNPFLKIFSAVRNFYDPFINLKAVSQRSISILWGLSKVVYFILDNFQRNLAHH